MTDVSKVRLATQRDEPALMEVCHALHRENGLFPMDDELVRNMLYRAFARQGGIIGVIGQENDIQAAIYVLISNYWYTRNSHLEELFNWVRPDCRKSDHAETLIESAKGWAVEIGVPLLIGVVTNKRMEGKVRLYRRKLGYPSGAFFVYNATWDCEQAGEDFWRNPFPKRTRVAGNGMVPEKSDAA